MNDKLCNLVSFEIDRLFNGAVNVDWIFKDHAKAEKAATSFVFHGPGTHSVAATIADGTGHRLVDTATFVANVVSELASPGNRPFVLAIASYGSGKSHLAVTLSQLLSDSGGNTSREEIIRNIRVADSSIAQRVDASILEIGGPVLVITLNGMNNADLASVLLAQLKERISADGHSIKPLESLRQRFQIAAKMLGNLSPELSRAFVNESGFASVEECQQRLEMYDELIYNQAQKFYRSIGLPIQAIGDETVKDVLERVAQEYLGPDKPYARMLLLFDEFGHYLEFAASKPQVAGDGALQHLFEGVQSYSDKVSFVGFIQFELKSYIQRLGSLIRNEAERYVTRFDSAEKYYLSSNLETLVASLLVKKESPTFDADAVEKTRERLLQWYESAKSDSSWSDADSFAKMVKGCWPLSPETMWVLYYISSGGRFLQQRSALSLLKSALDVNKDMVLDEEHFALPPVALWTRELHDEFVGMENSTGTASTVVQAYDAIYERNEQHLSNEEKNILRALVLIEQTKLRATSRNDMVYAVSVFAGIDRNNTLSCLNDLENDKNVIGWDEVFHRFELLADTASKAQFRSFIRKKSDQEYDEERRNSLFVKRASELDLINGELRCGFGEEKKIYTQEWDYEPQHTTWDLFRLSVSNIADALKGRSRYQSVTEKRGLVVYCYVSETEDGATVLDDARRMIQSHCSKIPFLLVLLFDKDRRLSEPLVKLDILESLSDQEKAKYDRLISIFQQEQMELLTRGVREAILERHVLVGVALDEKPSRLKDVGDAVFNRVFTKVISFPFDGYSTRGGNASKDCAEFTRALFLTDFSWDTTQSMGIQKKNRAQGVLGNAWFVFDTKGMVTFKRAQSSVKALMEEWNKALYSDEGLSVPAAFERACAAPFGANTASAGLLLSVFYRSHVNAKDIQAMSGDNVVDIQSLSELLPDKKPIVPDVFAGIRFVKAESGEDSPWQLLIDEWLDCIMYREKLSFSERIDDLRVTNPTVPPTLRVKLLEITNEIEQVRQQIDVIDAKESDHINRINKAIEQDNAYQLAFGVSLLADDWKAKVNQACLWDKTTDIDPLETQIRDGRQRLIALFPQWLEKFNPKSVSLDAVADYQDNAKKMGRSLRNLELTSQEEALKRRVESVLHQLEAIGNAKKRKADAEAWCEVHTIIPLNLPSVQIEALKTECEQYRETLQSSMASMRTINPGIADELVPVYKKLTDIKDDLDKASKALARRAKAIMNKDLTMETARELLDEIGTIISLYEGSGKNLEDFRDARIEVDSYLTLMGVLSNIETSEEIFRARIEQAKTDFVGKYTEIDPLWDPQEVFDALVVSCEKSRAKASKEWVSRMLEKYSDPSSLSPEETIAALDELARRIPCFNPKDAIKLAPVEKALTKHKDNLGVDLLVAQFKALSPTAKKLFLSKIHS